MRTLANAEKTQTRTERAQGEGRLSELGKRTSEWRKPKNKQRNKICIRTKQQNKICSYPAATATTAIAASAVPALCGDQRARERLVKGYDRTGSSSADTGKGVASKFTA